MKTLISFSVIICLASWAHAAALWSGGEERVVIVLRPDGTGSATNATVQSRATAEQSLRWFVQYQANMEGAELDEEGDDAPAAPAKVPEPKTWTDAELVQAIRDASKYTAEQLGAERQVDSVVVTSNEVRTSWSQQFANPTQFLEQINQVISQAGVNPENIRLESTNGQLHVTLTPSAHMKRYSKTMRDRWKVAKSKAELTWILPGKVLTSGLPEINGNAASIKVTSDDEKSIDAFVKLNESPVVITAELNGFKLDQPLDSKSLRRIGPVAQMIGGDLPVTNAGPGFVAEAISVTTSTLSLFPEGKKMLPPGVMAGFPTGTVVRAKLFAPKGRGILSASEVRVTKAVDDQGRSVASIGNASDTENYRSFVSRSMEEGDDRSAQLELRLQLPAPDAESISDLTGEAVVVTTGKWKEFAVTNLQANATNTFDLSSILPGAKLTMKKVTRRKSQVTIEAQVTGPAQVRNMEFKCRQPGSEHFNSYSNDRRSSASSGQTSRTVQIQCSNYGDDGLNLDTLVLVVRFPDELRRERVPIKLSNLDLL